MADFFYTIMFSPPAFGNCNAGNTFIDLVQINGRSQLIGEIETLRLADNPCAFLNDGGFNVGMAGTTVDVVIQAHVDTAAVGNRTFSFFMCADGRQYTGPVESEGNDADGQITLEATYTVGPKVPGGDCASFLRSKIGAGGAADAIIATAADTTGSPDAQPSAEPKSAGQSKKARTKQIIKRIIEP